MRRLRNRRGATIVLVALLLIPIIGFVAWVVDTGRWNMGAAQLQTSADAAALAGARALQTNPGNLAEATTKAAAVATGATNVAYNLPVVINPADVEPMFWNPDPAAATPLQPAASWATANAVRVTATRQGGMIFGGIFNGPAAPATTRQATAWIANINSGTCVKPWGLPYPALYDRIVQLVGGTPSSANPRPPLTQAQLAALNDIPESQRFIIFRPPTYDYAYGTARQPDSLDALGSLGYNNGMYTAFNFTEFHNNASGTTYREDISRCVGQKVEIGENNTAQLPGNNDIPCYTVNALMGVTQNQVCNAAWPGNATVDAPITCSYTSINLAFCGRPSANAAQASDTVAVAWVDQLGSTGQATEFRLIGKIRLLCVFRKYDEDAGGNMPVETATRAGALADPNPEICRDNAGVELARNYPRASMVGIIQGLSQPRIDQNTTLGNVTSDQQRLILVR